MNTREYRLNINRLYINQFHRASQYIISDFEYKIIGCKLPKTSIVIPTHNRALFLKAAIDSLLKQTVQPDEIIVVDDGSIDDTSHLLSTFGSKLNVISQAQSGRSQARNIGLARANGDFIAFLDDDDILPPTSIEVRAEYLNKFPQIDVVYTDALSIDGTGKSLGKFTRSNPRKPSGFVFSEIAQSNFAPIHAYMFRRHCLKNTGLFDPNLSIGEDWDFWIRMAANHDFMYIPQALAHYRFHNKMSSQGIRQQLALGSITVQRRVFEMPRFQELSNREQAHIYFRHANRYLRVNQLHFACQYYQLATRLVPTYIRAHIFYIIARLLERFLPQLFSGAAFNKIIELRRLR